MSVPPADERRHRPGPGPDWEEAWAFELADAGAGLGAYVRLGLHPAAGVSWYWAALVRDGRPLVTVLVDDAPLPAGAGLDLRAEGLWCDQICETPLEHWTLGLEAFAVALDDPDEVFGRVMGTVTALGLDVEWEAAAPAVADGPGRYTQACAVHGEILVGPGERLLFEGHGHRSHTWGDPAWDAPWWALAGRLDDGTAFAARGDGDGTWPGTAQGWVAGPDGPVAGDAALTGGGGATGGTWAADVAGLALELTARHRAPARVDGAGGPRSRLPRALCRVATADGRAGAAWLERNEPVTAPRRRQTRS